jgi:hypothetical protein
VYDPTGHQPASDQRTVRVVGAFSNLGYTQKKVENPATGDSDSDKTELLAHHREDEIRVLFGQECEPFLRTG